MVDFGVEVFDVEGFECDCEIVGSGELVESSDFAFELCCVEEYFVFERC